MMMGLRLGRRAQIIWTLSRRHANDGRMQDATVIEWIREKYGVLPWALNGRSRRLWASTEARSLGHGGVLTPGQSDVDQPRAGDCCVAEHRR